MKYKIRIVSIAMATIVLVAMGAVVGVSAAQPATVAAPITGAPAVCNNGANLWYVAQGTPDAHGNTIYYKVTGTWMPLGTGTNPTIMSLGTGGSVAIFARGTNGQIWGKQTADNGATWTNITLPTSTAAAGTGPVATYDPVTLQMDVFYVNSAHNLVWLSQTSNAQTVQTNLGGIVFATPAATSPASGTIVVIVKGTGGVIYEKTMQMGGFSGWTKFHDGLIGAGATLVSAEPALPTAVRAGPALVSDGAPDVFLFVTGTNSRLYMAWSYDDGVTWVTNYQQGLVPLNTHSLYWANLGGVLTSSPSAATAPQVDLHGTVAPPSSTIVVVARGGDGGIWTNTGFAPWTISADWSWSTTSIAGP
jgi:hypothetical protein